MLPWLFFTIVTVAVHPLGEVKTFHQVAKSSTTVPFVCFHLSSALHSDNTHQGLAFIRSQSKCWLHHKTASFIPFSYLLFLSLSRFIDVKDVILLYSVVVKDLRLKDEYKDSTTKDEDLKIGPRGQGLSSRTTTLLWSSTVRLTWTRTWPRHNDK